MFLFELRTGRTRQLRGGQFIRAGPWNQHWNAAAVLGVLAMKAEEIALFELNGHEDIGGSGNGEEQMRESHQRSRPENHDPTNVKRMAHVAIQEGRPEARSAIGPIEEPEPDLSKPKKIEVIDQGGAEQHDEPAESKRSEQGDAANRIFDVPNDAADWLPLPEHQEKSQGAQQDVGAAFDGGREEARPDGLEPSTRHDAVLKGEEGEESEVRGDGRGQGNARCGVERRGNSEIPDEANGINESGEEDEVA